MNLEKLSIEVGNLCKEVGANIIQQRLNFDPAVVVEKGLNQLVSFVDIEAEKQLVEGLKKIVPEAGFITEENTVEQLNTELVWIIDPLDGTTNFIHNLPVYSISTIPQHAVRAFLTHAALIEEQCSITGESIDIANGAITTCFHTFQKDAIARWLSMPNSQDKCPVCNTKCNMFTLDNV